MVVFFFFQAEDGIRDLTVTGVQTCALPISFGHRAFTDSAPVLEAELARRSGQGWRGKHTLVLNREAGSMFFLGEIYVDLALEDRKSTRLNSSHSQISYAVFCLKKKKNNTNTC